MKSAENCTPWFYDIDPAVWTLTTPDTGRDWAEFYGSELYDPNWPTVSPEFYDPIGQRFLFMGVRKFLCYALGFLNLTNFLSGGDDKMTKMAIFA